MTGRLQDKVAIITGGASGIGAAAAPRFVAEGARVMVSDIDADGGEALAGQLGAAAAFQPHDTTNESDWERVVESTRRSFGGLDVLLNVAGVGTAEVDGVDDIEHCSLQSWRKVHAVNLDGVFLGCRYAVGVMKLTSGGSIVNLSSILGTVGDASALSYCSSKGAVRLLSKSVALHCAEKGYAIRCNSVHPGYIDTPMVRGLIDAAPEPEVYHQGLVNLHPIGRLGRAEEVAALLLYLASDESRFVTGAEFTIDGGYTT